MSRSARIRLACLFVCLLLPVLAWAQGDSIAVDSIPSDTTATNAHAQFVLGIAGLAAFIAQAIGSALVTAWNKAGGWLENVSNGSKRVLAVAITGALGLALNAVGALLTHSTSWLLTFGLSVVAGVISTLTTGMAIDTAKAKMIAPAAKPYQSNIR